MNMTFDSEEEECEFYNRYAKLTGLSTRWSTRKAVDDGAITYRKWLCSRQGYREVKWFNLTNRKKEPKAISRERCNVMFSIKYDYKVQKFVVAKFIALHSHELA
ncbi:hypothetical protein ACH5RR_009576, partial [Cinchona calisaya]